jgi:hypothetical protein
MVFCEMNLIVGKMVFAQNIICRGMNCAGHAFFWG